jgi:hypothetical protein
MRRLAQIIRVARLATTLLLAVGTTALALIIAVNRPHGLWTSPHHRWILALAVGVIAVVQGLPRVVESLWRIPRGDRRRKYERKVNEILGAGYVRIVEISAIPFTQIGFHAFLVKPGWRKHLVRVGRVRLPYRAESSGIRWTKGKGVIGECWRSGETIVADNTDLLSECKRVGKLAWNSSPAESRMGLSYDECLRTKTFGAIMAVPIVDRKGEFRGCVSLDAPPGSGNTIDAPQIRQEMQSVADAIWIVGRAIDDL